ncbi:unnamed protein product (macronuclear) [Paramecium tetraurelia]|uniref:Transmembrane protein n=1 Tax=Paramecium tetraurelia TaxID=5888 RepID=A0CLG1_PARTE|nr:uncharacterized protein GSPATT00008176001 [Paramecium tetraurelia]CAK71628.1 unnamed protein product [Paramecium tetraurelia]|eukprot:XP_001439025.1 hypothetical protein (macronuclear) [Paramecium tetraurelia strain d4-2]
MEDCTSLKLYYLILILQIPCFIQILPLYLLKSILAEFHPTFQRCKKKINAISFNINTHQQIHYSRNKIKMQIMQKCFMIFENSELEKQYQLERSLSIKKPVFICTLILTFVCNVITIIIQSTSRTIESQYIYIVLTLITILEYVTIITMKKIQFLQLGITFTNIMLGFIQLDVDSSTATTSEFYAYGNVIMQLQAALYIISSFSHAIIQVTSHLILRILVTIYQSNQVDSLLIGMAFFGALMTLVTAHYYESRSRLSFIQNLQENKLEDAYSFIIQRPYFKISLSEDTMLFNLNTRHQIEQFPGFDEYYCDGCNARSLMRSYTTEKKQSFESLLLSQKLENNGYLIITFKKQTFQIKYCKVDLQQQNYLIILQDIDIQDKKQIDIEKEQLKLEYFLKSNQDFKHKKLFNWGVLSILMLNNKVIKRIDLKTIISKLIHIYKKYLFPELNIEIVCCEQNFNIYSFKSQLKIFLIQIFEIISKIQYFEKEKIEIVLQRKGCDALIKIQNVNQMQFNFSYAQNFFIQHVQSLLINYIDFSDCIGLLIRNHPIGTFNRK